ncbi:MAG: hypothetical protein KJS97_08085 [Alphaproteobacteria bacterium]|nr:hypothetical protein [Alphaproteobacteria bacterium]
MTERLSPLELPQASGGAPLPHVFADEERLLIAYIVEVFDPDWDGATNHAAGSDSEGEVCALIKVDRYLAFQFGPPNDEAISGHRLYELGLRAYSSFEILNSEWIGQQKAANRVHPHHRDELFEGYRHIVITFHDSTLEFIARGFAVQLVEGPIRVALLRAATASE